MKTVKRIILGIVMISFFVTGDFFFKVYMTSLPNGLDIVSKITLFPFYESSYYKSNIPQKNGNAILSVIESGDEKTLRIVNPNQNDYLELTLPKFSKVLFSSDGNKNEHPQIIMWDDLFELVYSGALLEDNYTYELNLYKIIDGRIVLQEKIQSDYFRCPDQMSNEGVVVRVIDSDKTTLPIHLSMVKFHNADGNDLEHLDINFQQYQEDIPLILTNDCLIFQSTKKSNDETISVYSFKTNITRTYTIDKPICGDLILAGKYDTLNDVFVWIDCDDNKTINSFDTYSGTLSQIITDGFEKSYLAINNKYLLWVRNTGNKHGSSSIYGNNLETGEKFLVAKNMFNVSKPIFLNGYVYWSSVISTVISDRRYVFRKKISEIMGKSPN